MHRLLHEPSLYATASIILVTIYFVRRRMQPQAAQSKMPTSLAAPRLTEAVRARQTDLALLGHHIANQLVADGACPANSGLARIWRSQIMPRAIPTNCGWNIGTTAAIDGLTSKAGSAFNGLVGRISGHTEDGRWEVLVRGPEGIGTANIKPQNLRAATDLRAILTAWRDIPNRSQMPKASTDQRALTAVTRRDALEIQALVSAKAELCGTDEKGRTALHVALEMVATRLEDDEEDDEEMALVNALLGAHGDHVNAPDSQGRTPLLAAVRMGHHEAVRLLLAVGADASACDSIGSSLHHATSADMVPGLLQGAAPGALDVNGRGKAGWTPLGLAARSGNLAMAEVLLEHGADREVVVFNGKTALDIARANARVALVALLEKR